MILFNCQDKLLKYVNIFLNIWSLLVKGRGEPSQVFCHFFYIFFGGGGPNTWKESQKLLEGKGSIEFLLSLTQTKRNGSILVRMREAVFSQWCDPWSALMCPEFESELDARCGSRLFVFYCSLRGFQPSSQRRQMPELEIM